MEKTMLNIAVPYYLDVTTKTMNCIFRLTASQKYGFKVSLRSSALIHHNRNQLWYEADTTMPYLLFIDSDIVFTEDDIDKLVSLDKDIACGWYLMRGSGDPAVHFRYEDVPGPHKYKPFPADQFPDDPFRVDGVGFGFVLIKTSVIEDWKRERPDEAPFDFINCPEMTPVGRQYLGEDFAFCVRMQQWGKDIWVHPDVHVGHVTQAVLTRDGVRIGW